MSTQLTIFLLLLASWAGDFLQKTQAAEPVIVLHPANKTNYLGDRFGIYLSVDASGATEYRWYEGVSGDQSKPLDARGPGLYVNPQSTTLIGCESRMAKVQSTVGPPPFWYCRPIRQESHSIQPTRPITSDRN